jgi:hypothetical protein
MHHARSASTNTIRSGEGEASAPEGHCLASASHSHRPARGGRGLPTRRAGCRSGEGKARSGTLTGRPAGEAQIRARVVEEWGEECASKEGAASRTFFGPPLPHAGGRRRHAAPRVTRWGARGESCGGIGQPDNSSVLNTIFFF